MGVRITSAFLCLPAQQQPYTHAVMMQMSPQPPTTVPMMMPLMMALMPAAIADQKGVTA